MKTVIKLALGVAIAGVLINLLAKRRSRDELAAVLDEPRAEPTVARDPDPQDVAGENAVWGGGSSGLNV
ncbi:MAG TPA: hypothetical protein VFP37_16980 [Steroidobacteraceae bacterium]|nr:hypothetical protein [Steroidobacteraceae bacterium]